LIFVARSLPLLRNDNNVYADTNFFLEFRRKKSKKIKKKKANCCFIDPRKHEAADERRSPHGTDATSQFTLLFGYLLCFAVFWSVAPKDALQNNQDGKRRNKKPKR